MKKDLYIVSKFIMANSAEEALKNSEAYKKDRCTISIKEFYLDDVPALI